MSSSIEVHGWKSSGPVYTVTTRRAGFRARRKPPQEKLHGVRGGRNVKSAAFSVVQADSPVALFNKGYEYEILLDVDGSRLETVVDALEDYAQLRLSRGVSLVAAQPVSVQVDDDDGPESQDREVAAS